MTITRFAFQPKDNTRSPQTGFSLLTRDGKPTKLDIHVLDVARIHTPYQRALSVIQENMLDVNKRLAERSNPARILFNEYPTFWIQKPRPSLCLSFVLAQDGQPTGVSLKRDMFCPDVVMREDALSDALKSKSNRAYTTVNGLLRQWHTDFAGGHVHDRSYRSGAHLMHVLSEKLFNQAAVIPLHSQNTSAIYAASRQSLTCPIPTLIRQTGMIARIWAEQSGKATIYIPNIYDGVTRGDDPQVVCANPLSGYVPYINAVQLSCAVSGQVSPFSRAFIELAVAAENDLNIQHLSPGLCHRLERYRRADVRNTQGLPALPAATPGLA